MTLSLLLPLTSSKEVICRNIIYIYLKIGFEQDQNDQVNERDIVKRHKKKEKIQSILVPIFSFIYLIFNVSPM